MQKDRDTHIDACFELFAHLFLEHSFRRHISAKFIYPEHGFDIHCPPENIFVTVRTLFNGDLDKQLVESCSNTQLWIVLAVFDPIGNHPHRKEVSPTQSFYREDWHGWQRLPKLLGIWVFNCLCFSDPLKIKPQLLTNIHHPTSSLPKMLNWFESPKPPPLDFTGTGK